MLDKLEGMLGFQQRALALRHQRQSVLASNIANADTPGYQARDINFSQQLQKQLRAGESHSLTLATTSDRHLASAPSTRLEMDLLYRVPYQSSLDGNTVEMDVERSQFADNTLKYQASFTALNGQIKKMMSVLQ